MIIKQFIEALGQNPLGSYKCSSLRNDNGLVSHKYHKSWRPYVYIDDKYFARIGPRAALHRNDDSARMDTTLRTLSEGRITLDFDFINGSKPLPPRVRKVSEDDRKEYVRQHWRRNVFGAEAGDTRMTPDRTASFWQAVHAEAICNAAKGLLEAFGKVKASIMREAQETQNSLRDVLQRASSGELKNISSLVETAYDLRQVFDERIRSLRDINQELPLKSNYSSSLVHCTESVHVVGYDLFDRLGNLPLPNLNSKYRRQSSGYKIILPKTDSATRYPESLHAIPDAMAHFGFERVTPFGLRVNVENTNKLAVLADAATQRLVNFFAEENQNQNQNQNENESNPHEITI